MDLVLKGADLFEPLNEQQGATVLKESDSYLKNNMDSSTDNINLNSIYSGLDEALSPWIAIINEFNQYFDECGIINDFDEYLLIKNMDR